MLKDLNLIPRGHIKTNKQMTTNKPVPGVIVGTCQPSTEEKGLGKFQCSLTSQSMLQAQFQANEGTRLKKIQVEPENQPEAVL